MHTYNIFSMWCVWHDCLPLHVKPTPAHGYQDGWWKKLELDMCLVWPCSSKALSLLCKFVFAFQYNPICGDIHSASRYGNKHNTSLHLWPPSSSSSLWMQCNNGEEQGRGRKIASLFSYLLMVHKLKDSGFNSENKSVRKAANPLARYFLHRMWGFQYITQEKWRLKIVIFFFLCIHKMADPATGLIFHRHNRQT